MAEVNAAWAVLGDHGRRARYDAELVAAGATSTPEDPLAHLVRRQRTVDEVEQGPDPDAHGPPPLARALPVVVVLGVLLAIFVFTAYAGDDEGGGPEQVQTAEELPVGTCVTLPSGGAIEPVDCQRPNDGIVADAVPWPEPCPVPLKTVPWTARQSSLCLRD